MTTARDIVKRALRQIGMLASGEDPASEDANDVLAALNGMLSGWTMDGIRMNLPELALTDTVALPAGHIDGICFNLAITIAPEFGANVSPALATLADRGKQQLQRAYIYVPEVACERELSGTYRLWVR